MEGLRRSVTLHTHATDMNEAWEIVHHLGGYFKLDRESTQRAGYSVFRHEELYYQYVCDLGNRLELNMENGDTINVWILVS